MSSALSQFLAWSSSRFCTLIARVEGLLQGSKCVAAHRLQLSNPLRRIWQNYLMRNFALHRNICHALSKHRICR